MVISVRDRFVSEDIGSPDSSNFTAVFVGGQHPISPVPMRIDPTRGLAPRLRLTQRATLHLMLPEGDRRKNHLDVLGPAFEAAVPGLKMTCNFSNLDHDSRDARVPVLKYGWTPASYDVQRWFAIDAPTHRRLFSRSSEINGRPSPKRQRAAGPADPR
jgi:hypothetical protein